MVERNYAPLLRLPYNDLSGIIKVWADSCNSMAVYEHDHAEKNCKTTHVHMIMLGCRYKTPEQLKRQFFKHVPGYNSSDGNGLWSWENKEWPNPDINFIGYMSDGTLEPKFVKNISQETLDEQKRNWIPKKVYSQTFIDPPVAKDKLTKHSIMLKVVNLILTQHPDASEEQRKRILSDLSDELWIKHIRKVLIQERQMLGLYKVMDIYDACQMYYAKDKFISNCLNVLQKRIPRI